MMSYPYNNEADAEVHVRAFLTMSQANHVSQCLAATNTNASKIVEFSLSLEGQVVNWYSPHALDEFQTFPQLREKILQLFHWRNPH